MWSRRSAEAALSARGVHALVEHVVDLRLGWCYSVRAVRRDPADVARAFCSVWVLNICGPDLSRALVGRELYGLVVFGQVGRAHLSFAPCACRSFVLVLLFSLRAPVLQVCRCRVCSSLVLCVLALLVPGCCCLRLCCVYGYCLKSRLRLPSSQA